MKKSSQAIKVWLRLSKVQMFEHTTFEIFYQIQISLMLTIPMIEKQHNKCPAINRDIKYNYYLANRDIKQFISDQDDARVDEIDWRGWDAI